MNTQQSSWLMSFGLMPPPISAQDSIETESVVTEKIFIKRETREKAKIIRKLKEDIVEKMEQGIAGRINIYAALLAENRIPVNDQIPMTIKAFGSHLIYVKRNIHRIKKVKVVNIDNSPKGQKAKAICDLFASGVSEENITKIHGFDRSYTYMTLIKYGRIEKRDPSVRQRKDTVKFPRICEMIKKNRGSRAISKETGATEKYVKQIMLERKRAHFLIGLGKSANEVCELLNICKFHAEYFFREVNSERKDKVAA